MAENPLKTFEKLDPKLLKLVEDNRQLALSDGVLPKKFKLLIAMVLDASHGAVGGVTSLAKAAMQAGASQEEIAEAFNELFRDETKSRIMGTTALKTVEGITWENVIKKLIINNE